MYVGAAKCREKMVGKTQSRATCGSTISNTIVCVCVDDDSVEL